MLLCAALVMAGRGAAAEDKGPALSILAWGGLAGTMTSMSCRDSGADGADYARLLAAIKALADDSTLLLSTGNVLGDDPFSRYLSFAGGTGTERMSGLLKKSKAVMSCLGPGELSLSSGLSIPFLLELEAASVSFAAANLECREDAELCPLLKSHGTRMLRLGETRVALVALVGQKLLSEANPANLDYREILDPVAEGQRLAQRARKQGADLVIALVNMDSMESCPTEALAFAQRVTGFDLILSGHNSEFGNPAPTLVSASLHDGWTRLVEIYPGSARLTKIILRPGQGGKLQVEVEHLDTAGYEPDPGVASALAQTRSEFCTFSMREVEGARLARTMTAAEFRQYVMEVARRRTRADLSMFSGDTLWLDPAESFSGALREGDMARLFPARELAVLEVRGKYLGPFLKAVLAQGQATSLNILGAAAVNDAVEVNSRPLETDSRYRFVTTNFMASGGGGLLTPILPYCRKIGPDEPLFLREVMKRYFEKDRAVLLGHKGPVDPDRDFVSLWELPRWDFRNSVALYFSNIYIQNDAAYDRSQFARSEALGLSGEVQSVARRSNRMMIWNNLLLARYGESSIEGAPLMETQDLLSLETSLSWTRFRNVYGPIVWIPVPMLKGKLESEFSTDAQRDYRHLEGTVTAGPQWIISDDFTISAGYGLRRELLYPDGRLKQGLEFLYRLNTLPLFRRGDVNVLELSSWFELFWSRVSSQEPTLEGIGSATLGFNLFEWLKMNLNANIYLFKEGGASPAFSADTAAGLSLMASFSSQRYW